jgi:phage gpG-like protein
MPDNISGAISVSMDISEVLQQMGALNERATDLRPVFDGPIDESVSELYTQQFATEGQFGGARWAPLAARTLLARTRRGHGRGGILRDTSRLWASLVKRGAPEGIRSVSRDQYERGTSVAYAVFHQLGTRRMPARKIAPDPLPARVVVGWTDIISRYITDGDLSQFRGF